RERHPWRGGVAGCGVAAGDGGGMAGEEEAAREQGDAEGVVSRPAWPTGQAPKCGIAAASVQGNQLGDRRGGRATACPRRCLDSAATEAVGSLGVAAGPVSPPHASFTRTPSNLSRTAGISLILLFLSFPCGSPGCINTYVGTITEGIQGGSP